MAPRGKFMSRSIAGQKRFSLVVHRDLPRHHGSKWAARMIFVCTREPSTPRFLPRLRSPVTNKGDCKPHSRIDFWVEKPTWRPLSSGTSGASLEQRLGELTAI